MNTIKGAILTICAALLLLNTIKILMPSGNMEKYIQFIMGIFILYLIINAIFGIEKSIAPINFETSISEQPSEDMLKRVQTKQILKNYENQLLTDFKKNIPALFEGLKSIEMSFVEDQNSENFGIVNQIKIINNSINNKEREKIKDKIQSLYGIDKSVIIWGGNEDVEP